MGDSVRAASDLNETANKSKIIFGAQAAEMNKWGSTAARNLGLSKQEALASAAGFGDMFSQLGFGGQAAASMSKEVVQMAADLGSFNNLPTADVADRMSAAFRGEFDSLQALIPNINAARVEQEALAMTGKNSAKDLTAQEKASATLAIVQKDGARAAGDFARTSGDQANAAKIAAASMQDFKSSIGTGLLPALTALSKAATPAFEWMTTHQTTMKVVALIIGGLLLGAFTAAAVAAWGFVAPMLVMAAPFLAIGVAIAFLIAGIVLLVKNWDTVKAKTVEVWNAIKSALSSAWDAIKAKFAEAWDAIKAKMSATWDSIKQTVVTKGAEVLQWFKDLPKKLLSFWVGANLLLVKVGVDIITGLWNGIKSMWNWLKDKILSLGKSVIQWAKEALGIASPSKFMAREVGRWIPAGIAMGIDRNAGVVDTSMAALTSDLSINSRVAARAGVRGVSGASSTDGRPSQLYMRSGALEIINGKAYITGVIEEQAFDTKQRAYA